MERDRFKTRTGFIIACIGSAVGMGNIWRFPIMVLRKYGGMTFLIVYILFVILIASSGMNRGIRTSDALGGGSVRSRSFRQVYRDQMGQAYNRQRDRSDSGHRCDGSRDRLYGRDGLDFQILLHGHLRAAVRDGH